MPSRSESDAGPFECAALLIAAATGRSAHEIKPDDRLIDDFLMDSLEYLEIAMMIEETWGILLDGATLKRLVTVADVARLLPPDARLPLAV
ncbi:hypothetical protein WJ69_34290 [Burkholderia ubonensis]|uniref:acyl carrier protein n=1 Tax=Burkholderia ubonensis TaxID=101571 RepID=UPI000755F368|nr:acyl carrier protein [Burkholderia ubonensis]KVN98527.1 hypothetical protein WJ69_34290 [Burkholderia ubonensis]